MMIVKALTAAALACAIVLSSMAASAETRTPPADRRIAAIVNRDAITQYDLDQRLRLVGLGTRQQQTDAARRRQTADVLRAMINERLQIQEATRQNIEVAEAEVTEQVADVERRNRMKPGDLAKILGQRGIDIRTLQDQIRAQLAWSKLVNRTVLPQIRVSDAEIAIVMKRMQDNKDKLQYRVQEIFLRVERPDQQAKVLQSAQALLAQLRAGADFELLARQFSQTGTASTGGDMGWLYEGQMETEVERVVKSMKTGQVAGPVRGVGGYFIIRLADRRTAGGRNPDIKTIAIAQAIFAIPTGASAADSRVLQDKAVQLARTADCQAFVKAGTDAGATARLLDDVVPDQITPTLRVQILALKTHQSTKPVVLGTQIQVYMRCDDSLVGRAPTEKDIRETLQRQKLASFADRLLKELRRSAHVDIRI